MTTHLNLHPRAPHHRPRHTGDSSRVAGTTPIALWQLDARDNDQAAIDPDARFASRLARQLVLVYTSHGETVLDLDGDNHLHEAAETTGRSYLTGIEAAPTARVDHTDQPISLVTLRWPRTADQSAAEYGGLFSADRLPISDDACVIAAIRPSSPTESNQALVDRARTLCTVAETAGLTPVLRIVAIGAPGDGDRFLYYATEAEATYAVIQATMALIHQVPRVDLLVFGARREAA